MCIVCIPDPCIIIIGVVNINLWHWLMSRWVNLLVNLNVSYRCHWIPSKCKHFDRISRKRNRENSIKSNDFGRISFLSLFHAFARITTHSIFVFISHYPKSSGSSRKTVRSPLALYVGTNTLDSRQLQSPLFFGGQWKNVCFWSATMVVFAYSMCSVENIKKQVAPMHTAQPRIICK